MEKPSERGGMVFLELEKPGVLEKGLLFIAAVIMRTMVFYY